MSDFREHPDFEQRRCKGMSEDVSFFYPDEDDIEGGKEACRFCMGCKVLDACRENALINNEQYGIQGGMTPAERRLERRRRNYEGTLDIEHGTAKGARQHYRLGERPCAECRIPFREEGRRAREAKQ
jgi:WhiB family transcriptional regulator, redox-sensing transcriptional regulator